MKWIAVGPPSFTSSHPLSVRVVTAQSAFMCNLYSVAKGQSAIAISFDSETMITPAICRFPGIFPDFAPIVRTGEGGDRELVMARWGMPGPPQNGGAPVTNIRLARETVALSPRAFAGLWTRWHGVRGPKSASVEGKHELFGFLTTEANAAVAPIHPKAMPVILSGIRPMA
jgi:putative SOS response-associated peptidase YedK